MLKIILAEDDRITRGGIASLISHSFGADFEVAGEAQNGDEALRLVAEQKPNLLLTDISMPKLNGLDLIRRVRETDPDLMIIIISGYNDFEYMQSAIQSGVSDYLLKPVLPEQIRKALMKAKEQAGRRQEFQQSFNALKQQVLESRTLLLERFYRELISGGFSGEEIREKADFLKVDLSGSFFCAAVFKVQRYMPSEDRSVRREDLMQFFLSDIVRRSYGDSIRAYSFAWNRDQAALILCADGLSRDIAFREINRSTNELVERMEKYLGITMFAAIGSLQPNAAGVAESFREARSALDYSFAMPPGSVISSDDLGAPESDSRRRPEEFDRSIIFHTKLCEREECAGQIRRLFAYYQSAGIRDPHFIKIDVFEIIMRVFSRTEELFKGPVNADYKAKKYGEILRCESLSALETWTLNFFSEYIGKVETERADRSDIAVARVKELAELSFRDENFSLDDVAAKLFISPNYLRLIFKQKTGMSFVEYLTDLRMKKAAELLAVPSLKVQQISEQVGYGNQQYFAMCFRKHFGCTPTDYRRLPAQRPGPNT